MNQAIAILKSGRSFAEAGAITGIPVDEIMKEWNKLCYQSNVEHAEEIKMASSGKPIKPKTVKVKSKPKGK